MLSELSQFLSCPPHCIGDRLARDRGERESVLKELIHKKMRTLYTDRNGFQQTFFCAGLTEEGADTLLAYGRLRKPFNVCVAAYFFCRHKIVLKYPHLPCVIKKNFFDASRDSSKFYPIELLTLVNEPERVDIMQPMFCPNSEDDPIPVLLPRCTPPPPPPGMPPEAWINSSELRFVDTSTPPPPTDGGQILHCSSPTCLPKSEDDDDDDECGLWFVSSRCKHF
uniref:PAZ domain-containing protein n=1 Tax=Globodera rostochiensis TaxID=31243 RepID=A0A914I0X0_GLORO